MGVGPGHPLYVACLLLLLLLLAQSLLTYQVTKAMVIIHAYMVDVHGTWKVWSGPIHPPSPLVSLARPARLGSRASSAWDGSGGPRKPRRPPLGAAHALTRSVGPPREKGEGPRGRGRTCLPTYISSCYLLLYYI